MRAKGMGGRNITINKLCGQDIGGALHNAPTQTLRSAQEF